MLLFKLHALAYAILFLAIIIIVISSAMHTFMQRCGGCPVSCIIEVHSMSSYWGCGKVFHNSVTAMDWNEYMIVQAYQYPYGYFHLYS